MNQKLAFVLRGTSISQFGVDTAEEFLDLLRTRLQPTQAEREEREVCRAALDEIEVQQKALEAHGEENGLPVYNQNHSKNDEYRALHRLKCAAMDDMARAEFPFDRARLFDHIHVVSLAEVSSHITDQYNYVDTKDLTDRRFNRMRPSIAPRKRHQAG